MSNRTINAKELLRELPTKTTLSLLVGGLLLGPETSASSLLFSSGFEADTSISAPADCYSSGCWQGITGIDYTTGFAWPPSVWGGNAAQFQLLADTSVNSQTINEYMLNQLIDVAGSQGSSTKVMYSQVTQSGCCGGDPSYDATQNALQVQPDPSGPQGDLYISYWLKFQPDLRVQLETPEFGSQSPQNWRYLFSWKTGHSPGSNDGDYRIVATIVNWGNNPPTTITDPYWEIKADNNAGGPGTPQEFWRESNTAVPVPIGEWFKFEVFWHRSATSSGRVWMAVNGQPILDRAGPNFGASNLGINRIQITDVYGGGPYPQYQWLDNLQIWDGFPEVCTDPPCAPH